MMRQDRLAGVGKENWKTSWLLLMLVREGGTLDPGEAYVSGNSWVLDATLGEPMELIGSLIQAIRKRKYVNISRRLGGKWNCYNEVYKVVMNLGVFGS